MFQFFPGMDLILFGPQLLVILPLDIMLGKGYLRASFVSADRQVRVFGTSGIVYRPSDHLSVWNIPLYGYMYRRSCYIPFSSQ